MVPKRSMRVFTMGVHDVFTKSGIELPRAERVRLAGGREVRVWGR